MVDSISVLISGENSYMIFNPVQDCYVSSWYSKLPASIISVIVYGVGIPVAFHIVLYRHRKFLTEEKFQKRFSSLYFCYSAKYWYWEVIVKLRKFFLVIVMFLFKHGDNGNGTIWTATVAGIILFSYVILGLKSQPFRYRRNNSLQAFTSILNFWFLCCGILFFSEKYSSSSDSFLRIIILLAFAVALGVILFFIIREGFFAYKDVEWVRKRIPSFLVENKIISFDANEVKDKLFQPNNQNEVVLVQIHSRKSVDLPSTSGQNSPRHSLEPNQTNHRPFLRDVRVHPELRSEDD